MARDLIKLVSEGKTQDGGSTGTFYTTSKNKRTSTEKLRMKKFDRRAFNAETGKVGCHVMFKEDKIK